MVSRQGKHGRGASTALYRRIDGWDLSRCYYCGGPRESLDHAPSLYTVERIDLRVFFERGGKLVLVPACFRCNFALNKLAIAEPELRLAWLYERAQKRVARGTKWMAEELDELGPGLRGMVEAKAARYNELIEWYRGLERRLLEVMSLRS